MKQLSLLYLKLFIALVYCAACTNTSQMTSQKLESNEFSCMPCGQECDNVVYTQSGDCSHCLMPLVKKSTITFKTLQPSEICEFIAQNPGLIVVDVRTKDEFEGNIEPELGRIKNAVNVPVQLIESDIASLEAYKDSKILVYCSRSHRSPRASYLLNQRGFKNVINMAGGMSVMKDNSCKEILN